MQTNKYQENFRTDIRTKTYHENCNIIVQNS